MVHCQLLKSLYAQLTTYIGNFQRTMEPRDRECGDETWKVIISCSCRHHLLGSLHPSQHQTCAFWCTPKYRKCRDFRVRTALADIENSTMAKHGQSSLGLDKGLEANAIPSLSPTTFYSCYTTTTTAIMEYDLPHILALIVLLLFTIWNMLCTAFNRALGLVSSVCQLFGLTHGYPAGFASQSRPRNKKRTGGLGRTPGMMERITTLFGLASIVSLDRRPSLISCLAWGSRRIRNFAATCISKFKEWNPFNYFAVLRQLKAAQREARLLEEGLYQSTVEIKNLKALYKVKQQENLDLVRRVAEVENLEARLEEKGKRLEEEKQALVEEMETLRKEKGVEIEELKAEKEAEIVELKKQSRVTEQKNAEQTAALREEKVAVEKENEMLKQENTKIQMRVEEVEVEVKVAQEKAKVASAQLFGMEIARKEEGKKRMEAESIVVTLREELEIAKQAMEGEKKGREAERVVMEQERTGFEENTRKSNVEHRQEIDAFVGQLQGAWSRALDLNSQLDVANHHKNAFQAQLKDAQNSLAAMTGEKEILELENQKLQEEVARLREEVARAEKQKEVKEKEQRVEKKAAADLGIDLERLKKNFEVRDRRRKDAHEGDETTVAEECSVMDGEETALEITTDRFNTPGRKKQPAIKNNVATTSDVLLVATKDNLAIDADTPMVRLPAARMTRVLPPVQDDVVHTYVPPVETTSMVPLSFDPAPIQVRLPTASEPPRAKIASGNIRSFQPMKAKDAASTQYKKRKSRRGFGREQRDARDNKFDQTSRSPLGPITNQSSHNNKDRGGGKGILGRGGFW